MSFSSNAKEEICRAPISKSCCALAESYGVLLFCNTFSRHLIRVVTESGTFASRIPKIFKKAFGIVPDSISGGADSAKHTIEITNRDSIAKIFEAIGYAEERDVALHLNLGVLEEECCSSAFLRGAFLSGGSVTSPEKNYHLEIVTSHYYVSREAFTFLLDMDFEPKATKRKSNYVIYFKNSEQIEDFLTKAGAPVAAMVIMSAKVEKELNNRVNRRINCDAANADRTVDAAQEQLEAIGLLRKAGILDGLPERLRETARLREENPELSLNQLCEMFVPQLSKSCLNHRLRRLSELAKK